MLFMGIDAGTQGVRIITCDENGDIFSSKSVSYDKLNVASTPGYFEQDARTWKECTVSCIKKTLSNLSSAGFKPDDIYAIAVDATAPTIVPIDQTGEPIYNAIMYNCIRGESQINEIEKYSKEFEEENKCVLNAFNGLPKILWLKNKEPKVYEKAYKILSQADYISGLLTGDFNATDSSNALRVAFDLKNFKWPEFCFKNLGLDEDKFPKVYHSGSVKGYVSKFAAREFGLSEKTKVIAGTADAYASVISSGVKDVGDWCSVLGTTIVIKGVVSDLLQVKTKASYCYEFPTGDYLLAGASNAGGICLNANFDKDQFDYYNSFADSVTPTGIISYPLTCKGERFPFANTEFNGFTVGDISDDKKRYASLMEGIAFIEKYCYELFEDAGAKVPGKIFASGGGCKSDAWLQIRANVLGKEIHVPELPEAALGMAVLAASNYYGGLKEASSNMIKIEKIVRPENKSKEYIKLYDEFKEQLDRIID